MFCVLPAPAPASLRVLSPPSPNPAAFWMNEQRGETHSPIGDQDEPRHYDCASIWHQAYSVGVVKGVTSGVEHSGHTLQLHRASVPTQGITELKHNPIRGSYTAI